MRAYSDVHDLSSTLEEKKTHAERGNLNPGLKTLLVNMLLVLILRVHILLVHMLLLRTLRVHILLVPKLLVDTLQFHILLVHMLLLILYL